MARTMRFEQVVSNGNFTSKIHNLTYYNTGIEKAQVNDFVMIASSVQRSYSHYGLVTKILNNTSAIVKTGNKIYKCSLYNLTPILRCNE